MRGIVDSSVWSLALRRRPGALSQRERRTVLIWRDVVADGHAVLIGMVRQELLSGIRQFSAFDRTAQYLRDFEDLPLDVGDYEQAARCACICQSHGVALSAVDMLICGVAMRNDLDIMTLDHDFQRYSKLMPIQLAPI